MAFRPQVSALLIDCYVTTCLIFITESEGDIQVNIDLIVNFFFAPDYMDNNLD